MISDQLKLIKAIAPTPHSRVELPQIQSQEASSGIHLEVPACINHPKLSKAQKSYHLRYKTNGQAGAIVKQIALNYDNFNLALLALKARYEAGIQYW